MNSQAHEDIPWFASRPKFLPSWEGSFRTRAVTAETGRPPDAGIAWREGGHSERAWVGHRAGRGGRGEGWGSYGTRADAGEAGRVPSVRRSLIVKYLCHDDMSLAGGGLWRERSWLLPRKLVLFLLHDLFCMRSLTADIII